MARDTLVHAYKQPVRTIFLHVRIRREGGGGERAQAKPSRSEPSHHEAKKQNTPPASCTENRCNYTSRGSSSDNMLSPQTSSGGTIVDKNKVDANKRHTAVRSSSQGNAKHPNEDEDRGTPEGVGAALYPEWARKRPAPLEQVNREHHDKNPREDANLGGRGAENGWGGAHTGTWAAGGGGGAHRYVGGGSSQGGHMERNCA